MYSVYISDMLYIFPVIEKQSKFKPRILKNFPQKLFKCTSIIDSQFTKCFFIKSEL